MIRTTLAAALLATPAAAQSYATYQGAADAPRVERVYSAPAFDEGAQPYALTPPAGAPEPAPAATGDAPFLAESDTSRALLAMEEEHAANLRQLDARKAATRRKLLAEFEAEAADPAKVVGLAGRLKAAMAELEAFHRRAVEAEEKRHMEAQLAVLAADPVGR